MPSKHRVAGSNPVGGTTQTKHRGDLMSMAVGSAMKEDLERDWERKYNEDSLAVGSAMKEDLEEEAERLKDDSLAVGSAMKEDLERDQDDL